MLQNGFPVNYPRKCSKHNMQVSWRTWSVSAHFPSFLPLFLIVCVWITSETTSGKRFSPIMRVLGIKFKWSGSKCLSCWVISLTRCTHFLKRTWRVPDTKISYLILNSQLLSRMTWNGGEKEKFYKTESMAAFCILVVLNISVTEPFKNLLNKWIDKMCLHARNFIQSYRKLRSWHLQENGRKWKVKSLKSRKKYHKFLLDSNFYTCF